MTVGRPSTSLYCQTFVSSWLEYWADRAEGFVLLVGRRLFKLRRCQSVALSLSLAQAGEVRVCVAVVPVDSMSSLLIPTDQFTV